MNTLATLFSCETNAALRKACDEVLLAPGELSAAVWACKSGRVGISHEMFWNDTVPRHLWPTEKDQAQLDAAKPGEPVKLATKAFQMFKERRYRVGHLFWIPFGPWHMIHFDQRDAAERENHWTGGRHVHLMNYLTHPNVEPNEMWEDFRRSPNPKHSGPHIRYAPEE